ncbi:MAG: hypothetical protein MMC23_000075 [Stictis urceolatum]|nr:hypothetical protein [Stictis urceolata]
MPRLILTSSHALSCAAQWRQSCTTLPSPTDPTKSESTARRPKARVTHTAVDRVCFVLQTTLARNPVVSTYRPQMEMVTGLEEGAGGRTSGAVRGEMPTKDAIALARRLHHRDLNMTLAALRCCPVFVDANANAKQAFVRAAVNLHYRRLIEFLRVDCRVGKRRLREVALMQGNRSPFLGESGVWENGWGEGDDVWGWDGEGVGDDRQTVKIEGAGRWGGKRVRWGGELERLKSKLSLAVVLELVVVAVLYVLAQRG